jgi:hypothetical protein
MNHDLVCETERQQVEVASGGYFGMSVPASVITHFLNIGHNARELEFL